MTFQIAFKIDAETAERFNTSEFSDTIGCNFKTAAAAAAHIEEIRADPCKAGAYIDALAHASMWVVDDEGNPQC